MITSMSVLAVSLLIYTGWMWRRPASSRNRRRPVVLLIGLIAFVAFLSNATVRNSILRQAGWALVVEDQLTAADAIILSVDAGAAGVLEAADLVRSGLASRVVVIADQADPALKELSRRGASISDRFDEYIKGLKLLGIHDVVEIPHGVSGTDDTGATLAAWCRLQRCTSVIIVCSPDHSRRVRRVMRRAMAGHAVAVMVRPTHFALFNPDEWWRERGGIRIQILETQKLLVDFLRHPLS